MNSACAADKEEEERMRRRRRMMMIMMMQEKQLVKWKLQEKQTCTGKGFFKIGHEHVFSMIDRYFVSLYDPSV